MPQSWDDRYHWQSRKRDWDRTRGRRGRRRKKPLSPEEQALREARHPRGAQDQLHPALRLLLLRRSRSCWS